MQEHRDALERLGARIVALSSDDEAGARKVRQDLGLDYDVLYGLDAEATSALIGCYTGKHDGQPHVQPASFILKRDGTIALAVYSTGKVGRLTPSDAVTILKGLDSDA